MARVITVGNCIADAATRARARALPSQASAIGKVHAAGNWQDPALYQRLAGVLDACLASALRPDFEWYYCRGAFFHNDAHYDARLFGVWYIEGPLMQLVFPRALLRLDLTPSSVVVFDPFEVHGVLAPGSPAYAADDYQTIPASVFVGFEIDITADVAHAFCIGADVTGRAISSRTRIDPASGAIT